MTCRRRRVLIAVAVVAALIGGGTWWCWPRGDVRFVGKWNVFQDFRDSAQNSPAPIQMMTMHANGMASVQLLHGSRSFYSAAWTVEENRLLLGYRLPIRLRSGATGLARRFAKLTGHYPVVYEMPVEIVSVEPDEIRLRFSDGSQDGLIWRRVSE